MNDTTDRVGAKCVECGHTWVVLYLPMMLSLAAKIMKSGSKYCPKCGATGAVLAQDNELPTLLPSSRASAGSRRPC